MNENLRIKLIDAIASNKTDAVKEILKEVNGEKFVVRNFLDLMIASSMSENPDCITEIIFDFDIKVKKKLEEIIQRAKERELHNI